MSQNQLTKTASNRENAEIYTNPDACKAKSIELLEKLHLPKGLLPLTDVTEVGYNSNTGFVWLKQKRSVTHIFKRISRSVWYDAEVTAFVEDRRMKLLTGVKSKELMIWVSVTDILVKDDDDGKITFGTNTGISRSFPLSAFKMEEEG